MKTITTAAVALTIAMGAAGAAQAGPASDAFGECLVQSSTGKDRIIFAQWMFAGLSVHPSVAGMSNVTAQQRTEISQQTAAVMDRLVLKDCRAEAIAAIKQDGTETMSTSFSAFGRAAMTELMSNPAVDKQMSAIGDHIDADRWEELLKAGSK
ncbi:hypothetical protein [Caulobacter sp. 17J65-9]|uniref:hypothetical protein n=1 Tax=Caulobacter sp. 17J65-9 TaxID=2709382 RepID=UPI0013C8EFE7|nr:hypothetical protein [Caulobacter sp. 17J65-9]NEX92292.1 hypothetical protein [Caulobacter sp. 17J65-9]